MIGQQQTEQVRKRFSDIGNSVERAFHRSDNAVSQATHADIWRQSAYASAILGGFTFSIIMCFALWFVLKRR